LTIDVKAKIVLNKEKAKDGAPDYRVYAGGADSAPAGAKNRKRRGKSIWP